MPSYEALKNKQNELIRKANDGSFFIAPITAAPIASLTTYHAATSGPTVPAYIDLTPLPTDWDDLGWLTGDGVAFSREVSQSTVTSWGSVAPTRSDVTSDTTTLTVTAQETKLITIGLATGLDLAAATLAANTSELSVAKPNRPTSKAYRGLVVAVDQGDAGDIFIARFFPRAKVTAFSAQSFAAGDDPITWGVTLTAEVDSTLGYSERYLFGGDGWKAITDEMGFGA